MTGHGWVTLANGRQVHRRMDTGASPARSDFPCPMIIRDEIKPVRSMADGNWYDSMSSLRATYRADGNPQGVEYEEIGDAPMKGPPPMKHASKEEITVLLDQAEAAIARGEVPPVATDD